MPGRLNRRGIFDPRFARAFATVDEGGMTTSVLVRRSLPAAEKGRYDFDSGARPASQQYIKLWSGPARFVPNKDWRARGYTFGNESTVFQAVRFKLPLQGGEWEPDIEEKFLDEDEVVITDNGFPDLERFSSYVFVVRNPLGSGVAGAQNLLCDVNLRGGVNVGNSQ